MHGYPEADPERGVSELYLVDLSQFSSDLTLLTLATLKYFRISHGDQRVIFN